ncbi:MAG: helix-turn-helix domain-containing protein, partial [Clostridia bacterium]|nr:helix-turn-helix domain-containing protein [Clostridia bacterium]
AGDGSIDLACLPEEIRSYSRSPAVQSFSLTDHRQKKRAQAAQKERQKIITLLAKFGANVSRVAREMGVSRNTLYRKMKRYGIER